MKTYLRETSANRKGNVKRYEVTLKDSWGSNAIWMGSSEGQGADNYFPMHLLTLTEICMDVHKLFGEIRYVKQRVGALHVIVLIAATIRSMYIMWLSMRMA